MDNIDVVPPVRRRRLRDDVLELLKVIAHLVLVVAPTEIGRMLKAGVEYLWRRASAGRELRDKVARVRIRAQKLRTRVLGVHIHPSRAQQWASLAADITTFLAEYEEYESWGGWKCFLRKNIIKRAYDVALDGIEGFERAASDERSFARDAASEEEEAQQRAHRATMLARMDRQDAELAALSAEMARLTGKSRGEREAVPA